MFFCSTFLQRQDAAVGSTLLKPNPEMITQQFATLSSKHDNLKEQ